MADLSGAPGDHSFIDGEDEEEHEEDENGFDEVEREEPVKPERKAKSRARVVDKNISLEALAQSLRQEGGFSCDK